MGLLNILITIKALRFKALHFNVLPLFVPNSAFISATVGAAGTFGLPPYAIA